MTPTRRAVLIGGAAAVTAAAIPVAMGGIHGFLRRVAAGHFGPGVLQIDGVEEFIAEYAAQAGSGRLAKKVAAELYFAWRFDGVHKIAQADELENLFLQNILVRSNVIAIYQGRAESFEYTEVNPWEPTCGLYLSALADDTLRG